MRINYHEAAEDELLREIGYLERRAQGLGQRLTRACPRSRNEDLPLYRTTTRARPALLLAS